MTHLEMYKEKLKKMTIPELVDECLFVRIRAELGKHGKEYYTRVSVLKINAMSEELDRRGL